MAYMKLVKSKDEEEMWPNRERYKMMKEAKLVVTTTFEHLYVELEDKGGDE